ncbi:MAG: N-acetylmuramoyl-L-alanine amidase [Clostridia bacterium]|nr:N-acetylmuramoyl-L-alanine amidase [Clostridia bacterium]
MAIRVFIDQGHNPSNYNTGAEGNGYFEQDITYNIGKLLYGLFEQNPAFVPKLSRKTPTENLGTDNSSSLKARVDAANTWKADLFLSIHTNASENPSASGTEALIYGPSSKVAKAVGEDILKQLNLLTGLRNRGIVYRPGLYVLKKTKMPAVLVECGFISNPYDARMMVQDPLLFARGIYRGVLEYYGLL